MDFFSKVKRAFGFTADGSDFEDDIRVDSRTTPYVNPFRRDNDQRREETAAQQQSIASAATQQAQSEAEVAALKAQMQQLMNMMRNMQQAQREAQPAVKPASTPVQQPEAKHSAADGDDLKQRLQMSETQRRAAQDRANALTEKIEQLQVQVSTLENDKKGLLNKIRVMEVKAGGDGGTETTDAIEKMMEQHHEDLAEKDQQIKQLRQRCDELNSQLESTRSEMEGSSRAATAQAEEEIAQLRQQLEGSSRAATARDEEIASLREELAEANANLEIAAQVQQKLEEVEQFKEKKNSEIAKLKEQVKLLEKQLEQQKQEPAVASQPIENKSAEHIEPKKKPAPQPEPVKKSAKSMPRDPFAGIEQDLDDIDWLVPAVPDPVPDPEPEPEPEPQPITKPDPRQLSLF